MLPKLQPIYTSVRQIVETYIIRNPNNTVRIYLISRLENALEGLEKDSVPPSYDPLHILISQHQDAIEWLKNTAPALIEKIQKEEKEDEIAMDSIPRFLWKDSKND